MTVHFIGAGPGAPDLITVRGLKLIQSCPVCLYAGSLVPEEIVKAAPTGARVIDTASLTLEDIVAEIEAAHALGHDVAFVPYFPLESGRRWVYEQVTEWENNTVERETVVLSNQGRDRTLESGAAWRRRSEAARRSRKTVSSSTMRMRLGGWRSMLVL